MTIIAEVSELGRNISSEWRSLGYDEKQFSNIASRSICESKPWQYLDHRKISLEIIQESCFCRQRVNKGAAFGQPPATLFIDENNRFFIEMYLWSSPEMTIHDHPFNGAFSVISGNSLHETYSFDEKKGYQGLSTGNLTKLSSETLFEGSVIEIAKGQNLIHRNLHLAKPTVTFIVRQFRDKSANGKIYKTSGVALTPELSEKEEKLLSFIQGYIQLDDVEHVLNLSWHIATSKLSSFTKYQALKIIANDAGLLEHIEKNNLIKKSFPDIDSVSLRKIAASFHESEM